MMLRTAKLLVFWGLCVLQLPAFSQDFSPRFRHLTIDNGLSQNAVFAILQDQQGFMWFGTKDGLNRYDGYDFSIYKNDPADTASISNNYITALFEDSRNYLWAGTLEGGLNRLDRASGRFRSYRHLSDVPGSLSSNHITAITEDSSGALWIGTRNGLNHLAAGEIEKPSPRFEKFFHQPENPHSLTDSNIEVLLVDTRGRLWVGSANGISYSDRQVAGQTSVFVFHNLDALASDNFMGTGITALYQSRNGTIWLGTLAGLINLDPVSGAMETFPHRFRTYRRGWGAILDIEEDENGLLWLSTRTELMIFNPRRKRYTSVQRQKLNPASLSSNQLTRLFLDRCGVFWIGTNGYGLNLYDTKSDRFHTFRRPRDFTSRINRFSITALMEDRNGNVWISADVLYLWNRQTGQLVSFETDSEHPEDFGNTGGWSLLEDKNGRIWLAGFEGVYHYNPATKKYRHFALNSGLKEKVAYRVFLDRENRLWVGNQNYLSRYDSQTDRFIHYRYRQHAASRFVPLTDIYQDDTGFIWLATDDGLARFDPRTKLFHYFRHDAHNAKSLSNNVVLSITPDPLHSEILWLGTAGGGLNRFNGKKGTFSAFTEADGLPNNVVYAALPDKSGNLWMSTNRGLSRLNVATRKFRNFDISDGLQSNEFNTGAYFLSPSGEMFFGGIKGLTYFYPENIVDNPHRPNVVLTGMRLFNREISPKSQPNILDSLITYEKRVTLSYRENFIAFEFAALDFSAPSRNQYAYRMWGFDDRWITSGSNRLATYTNLPAGDYRFQVRGSNNDGVWNNQGASIWVHVAPPPWKTLWAYLLYGLAALGLLYGIRSYEMNRLRWKNRLQMERVEGEKLRDLDQMKSRFFANISHEFRTPLTLILGQVDRVMGETKDRSVRNRLEIALRNARRLLRLINQLLELSKIEAGNMQLKAAPINIVPLLKNAVFSFESLAEHKNITFHFQCPADPIVVSGEAEKLENIFYNLLSNAFKFTPDGGEVYMVCRTLPPESASAKAPSGEGIKGTRQNARQVEISVSDTGSGIAPQQLPHIFDRFYQVDGSHTREKEGSGIGLALVKELVEMHGGRINVTSEKSKGTAFTVILPIMASHRQADLTPRIAEKPALVPIDIHEHPSRKALGETPETNSEEQSSPKHKTDTPIILVVEDNADVRSYIRDQLELSHTVLEAGNGENGIEMARDKIPDLIITDVMMPQMDGYALSRMLKNDEKTCHIPIIMLTAKAALEDKIEGLETGADDYLIKPFNAKELVVRVKNLIESRRRLRERFREVTIVKPEEVTVVPMDQAFLQKVIATVEQHIGDDRFSAGILAAAVSMSISQLNRKLRALVDQPAGQLIRSMRLQRAADLLKQNAGNVAEICYQVGFSDQANFTRAFKKQFGLAPGVYKRT